MITRNNFIACSPFVRKSIELEVKKGFVKVKQKLDLTPLKVVFPDDGNHVEAGDTIYVRAETFTTTWAQEEFEVVLGDETHKFILVPYNYVVFTDFEVNKK